jgi:hypothetical protein
MIILRPPLIMLRLLFSTKLRSFIQSRYARREHSRSFDLRFERFKRRPDDFSAQARIQFFRQARIAAGMRNTHAFDDTICAHLHRHWKHRAH